MSMPNLKLPLLLELKVFTDTHQKLRKSFNSLDLDKLTMPPLSSLIKLHSICSKKSGTLLPGVIHPELSSEI